MAIPKNVSKYLDKNNIKYETLAHKTVYTAFDLANTLKKKLSEIAKTLVVKTDKEYYLVVIPAHFHLDLAKLKKALQTKKLEIAKENVMLKIFKVKPGAITPFGSLHKVGTMIDKTLLKTEKIIMGAGSFTDSVRLKMKDFIKAENPKVGDIGKKFMPETIAKPKVAKIKKAKTKIKKKK